MKLYGGDLSVWVSGQLFDLRRRARTMRSIRDSISWVIGSCGKLAAILRHDWYETAISSRESARSPARITSLALPYRPERRRRSMDVLSSGVNEMFILFVAITKHYCSRQTLSTFGRSPTRPRSALLILRHSACSLSSIAPRRSDGGCAHLSFLFPTLLASVQIRNRAWWAFRIK